MSKVYPKNVVLSYWFMCVCFLNFNRGREKESNDLFSHAVGTFLKMLFLTQVVS